MNGLLLFILMHFSITDTSLYSINVQKVDGGVLQMSTFSGKKLIIFAFDPGNSDSSQLRAMDSIQVLNPSLAVIAVPAVEFSDSSSIALITQQTNSGFSYIMTQPMHVLKSAGDNQDALFKWLTHVDQNTHFDADVETEGQTYFINENGILFAVMGKLTSTSDVENVLQQ